MKIDKVWEKAEWEGGIEGALMYFGPNLNVENPPEYFEETWRSAYNSFQDLQDMYEEWEQEQMNREFDEEEKRDAEDR